VEVGYQVSSLLVIDISGGMAAADAYVNQIRPGGVLPEVAGQNWILFGGIPLVLLVLLSVAAVIDFGSRTFSRGAPKGRIK